MKRFDWLPEIDRIGGRLSDPYRYMYSRDHV